MAENKKSFIAYCDWIELFEELSNEEAGKLVKHLFRYVNDLNPESPDKITKMCFIPIQQTLKRDLKKYEKRADISRENGSKGGRPKKPNETQETQQVFLEPRKPDSVSDSVSDSVNDINISFDLFWDLYDKKVGDKTKVEKKWNKLTNQQREDIVKYIPKYIASQPDKQYRKHPETFLNQKGWEDEIILKKPNRGEITIDSFQVW